MPKETRVGVMAPGKLRGFQLAFGVDFLGKVGQVRGKRRLTRSPESGDVVVALFEQ